MCLLAVRALRLGPEVSERQAFAGHQPAPGYQRRHETHGVQDDRGSDGVVIPGSYRNRHDAVNGSTVQLTLEDDIQFLPKPYSAEGLLARTRALLDASG